MRLTTFVTVLLASASLCWAGEIRLKDFAESSGPLVRLGDIAEIAGETAADGLSLADLALFPAPGGGRTHLLRRQELLELLMLCDLELKGWDLTGAETIEIRGATTLSRRIIRPALHLIPARSQVLLEPKAAAKAPAQSKAEELPPLVTRNGTVTVHSLASGIRVTTAGKSLAEGRQGQTVLVELDDSRERVLAQVVAPQVVEIHSGVSSTGGTGDTK
jgi:hypothetical protein